MPSNQQSIFQICHEQDGTLVLPLGDYLGIIGALLEAILTNRAAHDNSLVMLECEIPQRLVKLLTLERPYPALFQSTYLGNLANILRHLYVSFMLYIKVYTKCYRFNQIKLMLFTYFRLVCVKK